MSLQGLDWVALASHHIPAPFKPQIKNELDVSNFSEDFTNMDVTDSPAAVPLDGTKIFKVLCLTFSKLIVIVIVKNKILITISVDQNAIRRSLQADTQLVFGGWTSGNFDIQ